MTLSPVWKCHPNRGRALAKAVKRAGRSTHVTPHRLRHSTEMLQLEVSLPAQVQQLGHTALEMSLRYVQVTQQDLQSDSTKPARQRREPLPKFSQSFAQKLSSIHTLPSQV